MVEAFSELGGCAIKHRRVQVVSSTQPSTSTLLILLLEQNEHTVYEDRGCIISDHSDVGTDEDTYDPRAGYESQPSTGLQTCQANAHQDDWKSKCTGAECAGQVDWEEAACQSG